MKHCFSFHCMFFPPELKSPLSAKASGPQSKTAWQQGRIEIVSRFGKWKLVSKLSCLPPCLLFPLFEQPARERSVRPAREKSGQSSAVSPLMPVLQKCMSPCLSKSQPLPRQHQHSVGSSTRVADFHNWAFHVNSLKISNSVAQHPFYFTFKHTVKSLMWLHLKNKQKNKHTLKDLLEWCYTITSFGSLTKNFC